VPTFQNSSKTEKSEKFCKISNVSQFKHQRRITQNVTQKAIITFNVNTENVIRGPVISYRSATLTLRVMPNGSVIAMLTWLQLSP
jgi:hypothetical protein